MSTKKTKKTAKKLKSASVSMLGISPFQAVDDHTQATMAAHGDAGKIFQSLAGDDGLGPLGRPLFSTKEAVFALLLADINNKLQFLYDEEINDRFGED